VSKESIQVQTGVEVIPVAFNFQRTDAVVVYRDMIDPEIFGADQGVIECLPYINIAVDGAGKTGYVKCCKNI